MVDTATLEAQLAEAEAALHKVTTGSGIVRVEYDGGMTEFSRTNVPELRRYIQSLKRQLPDYSGRVGSQKVIF